MKGFFITVEGIEGSGKSVQVGLLASRLREEGYEIVVTREPGGTRIGEEIRNITHNPQNVELTAASEAYLMAASRAQLVREIIRPALLDGKIVIADRFIDSSLSYQGYGREFGEDIIIRLNRLATDDVFPDLTIFLDVSPKVGFARRNNSGKKDRLDLQQKDFYRRVYEGYKKLAEKHKERYFIVDSSKSIEEVAQIIWNRVKKILIHHKTQSGRTLRKNKF
ncbi:dTMP kinase [Candidatus Gottesmanbacteria bacterium]|nr:dTMP kinase [Candidatus Gottesmanbacteria bacterium]